MKWKKCILTLMKTTILKLLPLQFHQWPLWSWLIQLLPPLHCCPDILHFKSCQMRVQLSNIKIAIWPATQCGSDLILHCVPNVVTSANEAMVEYSKSNFCNPPIPSPKSKFCNPPIPSQPQKYGVIWVAV